MKHFYWIGVFMLIAHALKAQDSLPLILQQQYVKKVTQKANAVSNLISKQGIDQLNWLARKEKAMQAKLLKLDPQKAEQLFGQSAQKIQQLKTGLLAKTGSLTGGLSGQYNSYLDTLQASVKFLNGLKPNAIGQNIKTLQGKFEQGEGIETYIHNRKQLLKNELANYTGFGDDLKNLNKQACYYSLRLQEYKKILSDKDKAETMALDKLRKLPVFQNFMAKNSILAGLFDLNRTGNVAQDVQGLQVRSVVEKAVQTKAGTDPTARQALSNQMGADASQLNQFISKNGNLGKLSYDPGVRINPMKVKRTLDRIKLGGNVSFNRNKYALPNQGNFALQAAYELNPKSSTGVGISYQLGIGRIDKAEFKSQAIGMSYFFDWKVKKVFYAYADVELNRFTSFTAVADLKHWNGFQKVALAGMMTKVQINPKYKSTLLLAYNFLAKNQLPISAPLVVRLGFTK